MDEMVGNTLEEASHCGKKETVEIGVSTRRRKAERKTVRSILILLFSILILTTFLSSLGRFTDPATLNVFPMVPREGEPLTVGIAIRNFDVKAKPYSYELYVDGVKVLGGKVILTPFSEKTYSYSYLNQLELGEVTNFFLKVDSPTKKYRESLTVPLYHPHTLTSFVSFATFSTAMASSTIASSTMASSTIASSSMASSTTTMASMTSMAYYTDHFGATGQSPFNVGIIFSIVLIALLMHVEVTEPFSGLESFPGRIRMRFNRLSAILFIIFISMVFTQIVMILERAV